MKRVTHSVREGTQRTRSTQRTRRGPAGFSLIEVLMAIIILGIGVISIAALFPAGIAQQRRSVDDVMGPIVANNALAILRSKLRASDFGTFEQFTPAGAGGYLYAPRFTIIGDWTWLRPSILLTDNPTTNMLDETGALDIFSFDWATGGVGTMRSTEFPGSYDDGFTTSDPDLYGVPFNRSVWGDEPPRIIVTQQERYFPMASQHAASGRRAAPQYVWECMFRRHQGRVLVAIFVYRVNQGGGETQPYVIAANPSDSDVPPLPIALDLGQTPADSWDAWGVDNILGTEDDVRVFAPGNVRCDEYDLFDASQSWQESGQWILDQNNGVHRVLASYCDEALADPEGSPRVVEGSAVPSVFPGLSSLYGSGVNYILAPTSGGIDGIENVVTDIWYIPAVNSNGAKLTPVYLSVMEL